MINTHYKDLSLEERKLAVKRISSGTGFDKSTIKNALEQYNPLMAVEGNRIVAIRNAYFRLIDAIEKQKI